MFIKKHRIKREKSTVETMMKIYCRGQHKSTGLCHECRKLLDYSKDRIDRCPFKENKTTCANCRIHCYKPDMKEKIKNVMRYAGPRMSYQHPLLAFSHFLDGFRKEPSNRS
jgi:hypothetical protein